MEMATEIETVDIANFKWLQGKRIKYGKSQEVWEAVSRTTKKGDIDGVACLALVYTAAKRAPEILLVSQFRPPLGRRCVELPAGLTDSGETPLDTALRELKEETGYTGACHGTSPVIAGEAGLTDNTLRVVRVHVDGSAKVNQKPTPRPDHEEEVLKLRTHRLPMAHLQRSLEQLAQKENYAIDSRLYAFALGLEFSDGQPLMQPPEDTDPVRQSCDNPEEERAGVSRMPEQSRGGGALTKGLGRGLPKRRREKGARATDTSVSDASVSGASQGASTVGALAEEAERTMTECITESVLAAFSTWQSTAVFALAGTALLGTGVALGRLAGRRR